MPMHGSLQVMLHLGKVEVFREDMKSPTYVKICRAVEPAALCHVLDVMSCLVPAC